MPELPDIELYRTRLNERLLGETYENTLVFNPFVVRSTSPAPRQLEERQVLGVERLGKRLVVALADGYFIVIHLMIAGRLQWQSPAPPLKRSNGKIQLAALRFSSGQLTLVESSTRKRASIHFVHGRENLAAHTRAGLNIYSVDASTFEARLRGQNHTLKRVLTDPHAFDGIGNAFSDEILFNARLSPLRMSRSLSDEESARLLAAAQTTLRDWTDRLQEQIPGFPKPNEVTAFRPDFAVHGRFGLPCPVCGSPVQHIVYAENETNYCAKCQNEGRLLADRSLSRLLKEDWPKTLEEMLGG